MDKVKDKAKFHNPSSANSQPQAQTSNKNKHKSHRKGLLATGINTIKIAKKDKDKTKDLSYINCYTCKQKGYYANKCPKK